MPALSRCQEIAQAAARKYGLPENLVYSLVMRESSCNPNAVGPNTRYGNALGIAQIIPQFHRGVNALDPIAAIDYLARRLSEWTKKFGSYAAAVAAWHAGEPAVIRAGGAVPNTAEPGGTKTVDYVNQILSRAGLLGTGAAAPIPLPFGTPRQQPGSQYEKTGMVDPLFRKYLIYAVALLLIILAMSKMKR